MNVFEVSRYGLPTGLNITLGELPFLQGFFEMFAQALLDFLRKEIHHRIDIPGRQCLVARRYRGADVTTGGFESGKRRAFAGAMDAHERLKEIHIGQFARRGVEFTHRKGLVERVFDLRLIGILHPNEDKVDIAFR